MRIKYRIDFKALVVLNILLFVLSCGGKGDPTPAETGAQKNQKVLTAGTWSLQSVTLDGVDKTASFTAMKITFTTSAFTSTNGGGTWSASGNWSFTDDTGQTFSRNDGVTISLNEISTNKLVLSFTWTKTTLGPGRESSTSGKYVFVFTR